MDLSKLGTYLFMGLLAIFICCILNIIFKNTTFDIVISIVSIIIFMGYTCYDVKRILDMDAYDNIDEDNLAIYGAFSLYLDYINIFIDLLRLFGKNNDN